MARGARLPLSYSLRSSAPSAIARFTGWRGSQHNQEAAVYFTDRGIEELEERRGDEEVTLAWVADRMRVFVDLNPQFEDAAERLATFLARDDTDED